MTVKPIAAGTPQRIIAKINEIIGTVNTGGGSGGSGTADAILDAATIADAGKALGIDAEGEPALISVSGGGAPLLRCNLTYTGTDAANDPYVGHIDHASELVDALDAESSYNPLIVIAYDYDGDPNQTSPAVVQQITVQDGGETFTYSHLTGYSDPTRINVINALSIESGVEDGVRRFRITDEIANITSANASIVDNVLVYSA